MRSKQRRSTNIEAEGEPRVLGDDEERGVLRLAVQQHARTVHVPEQARAQLQHVPAAGTAARPRPRRAREYRRRQRRHQD